MFEMFDIKLKSIWIMIEFQIPASLMQTNDNN